MLLGLLGFIARLFDREPQPRSYEEAILRRIKNEETPEWIKQENRALLEQIKRRNRGIRDDA